MLSVGAAPQIWAPWAAAFCTLRYVRHRSAFVGIPLTFIAWAIAYAIGWSGVLPFQGWLEFAVPATFGVFLALPFAIDRLVAPRLPGALAWLVLPVSWVSAEFVFRLAGFGTWGAVAYSQFGATWLLQTLSLFGMAAIAFAIGAFASCANTALDTRSPLPVLPYAFALVLTLALGLVRVSTAPEQQTVRVAGVAIDNMKVFRNTWAPLSYGAPLDETQAATVRIEADALVDRLFERSAAAADSGARIIVWSEANALIFSDAEADLIERGRAFAVDHNVLLFMSAAVMRPGARLAENVILVIDDDGRLIDRYLKSHPTPGEMSAVGDGEIGLTRTEFGTIAWAICYDFDYPELIRQAGLAGASLLIDPAWEHAGMTPLHARMATLRATENGAALFRVTNGGLSIAADGYGRTIAEQAADPNTSRAFIADMPIGHALTPQSKIGDMFAYACLTLLLWCIGLAARAESRRSQ